MSNDIKKPLAPPESSADGAARAYRCKLQRVSNLDICTLQKTGECPNCRRRGQVVRAHSQSKSDVTRLVWGRTQVDGGSSRASAAGQVGVCPTADNRNPGQLGGADFPGRFSQAWGCLRTKPSRSTGVRAQRQRGCHYDLAQSWPAQSLANSNFRVYARGVRSCLFRNRFSPL